MIARMGRWLRNVTLTGIAVLAMGLTVPLIFWTARIGYRLARRNWRREKARWDARWSVDSARR